MTDRMFYVAIRPDDPNAAEGSCVDQQTEAWGRKLVKEFYRDHAGCEIRRVKGDEMLRLMNAGLDRLPQRGGK